MKTVRVRGHFGEYLQGRLGPVGPLGLITVPCPKTGLQAELQSGDHRVAHSLAGFLQALGLAAKGEIGLSLLSPPGAGTGISTARLIAAARLHGWQGPAGRLMAACVAEEGASDPLAFVHPERLLWASREGRILQPMPVLPAHDIVGGYFGAPCSTDPADVDFPDVSDIVADWQGTRDLQGFAELASESARRCLRMRGPADDPTEELARNLGAAGLLIAHTGSARGLIFPKGEVPPDAASALEAAGLAGVMQFGSDDG
ncbi:propanediol utilization protein [Paracoccus sp. Z118]|uniref:propanediol utilization protein n=1 Tax=Paracoccus sp. Z118 TaxID=2851017 RepID=UPI001C2C395D|nr:propanediol utilization protein [Paracoccus sp. Z118]MBV0892707.1 propanediol utilization protein [Paracoccus sp. Z118]